MPDIKVAGTFKDYHDLLNKKLEYLHKPLQDFKSKRLTMIKKIELSFNITVETQCIYISTDDSVANSFKESND